MRWECLSCGGTYEDPLADGMRYFHACPDLSEVEVRRALGLPLDGADLTPAQLEQVRRAPRARPTPRDENLVLPASSAQPAQIRAEGLGRRPARPSP